MPSTIKHHVDQLSRLGAANIAHRNGTLLKHLQGVWSLLNEWQNPQLVCLAGLYHSVYSTGGFEQQLVSLEKRHEIIDLIGAEAEGLVYLFAACDRPLTHPRIGKQAPMLFHDRFSHQDYTLEAKQWCALCEITLANELELCRHDAIFSHKHKPHYADLFDRFEPWLSDAAIKAGQAVYLS